MAVPDCSATLRLRQISRGSQLSREDQAFIDSRLVTDYTFVRYWPSSRYAHSKKTT